LLDEKEKARPRKKNRTALKSIEIIIIIIKKEKSL